MARARRRGSARSATSHGTTVLVGVARRWRVILGLRFLAPAVPGALVLVVGGLLGARLFDLGAHGVALVGDVPRGLPAPELPAPRLVGDHVATIAHRRGRAAADRLLADRRRRAGVRRAAPLPRSTSTRSRSRRAWRTSGAGLFQGMPVSTSLSASSLNESAGARTPMASLITGALVLLTLLVLAPLFSDLPKAVLGAVIIDAVVFGMIDLPELRRLRRVARFDFWIAVAAIVGVLSSGVLAGVVIGVALSLVWLDLRRHAARRCRCSAASAGTQVFRELDEHPGDETFPGVAVLRLDGGLFFATARGARGPRPRARRGRPARRRARRARPRGRQLHRLAGRREAGRDPRARRGRTASTLRLARVKPHVLAVLREDGVRRPARRRPHPRQRPPRRRGAAARMTPLASTTWSLAAISRRAARVHRVSRACARGSLSAGVRCSSLAGLIVGGEVLGWLDIATRGGVAAGARRGDARARAVLRRVADRPARAPQRRRRCPRGCSASACR